ncbi:dipeptidase [Nafulsella turpanensis]|uniref:dipeptidase n=1 Tax=Nafulsella turpanensis TaxID=1265690 RepID=UPI00036A0220|nr:membrane dipeptidase [Nafulsella turpanensis]
MRSTKKFPVFDLHCDLLSYLQSAPGADPAGVNDIGASLFYLQNGGVQLQVMAIYSDVRKGSTEGARAQAQVYKNLLSDYADYLVPVSDAQSVQGLVHSEKVGMVAAIENAAGFCEEDEPLEKGFEKLEEIINTTGPILYIGITHHTENRFGGGNFSEAGLKPDGEALLEYLDGRKIAIDLSHTSDALAEGIFNYTAKHGLEVPIIASHSNFRSVMEHKRNLPDEFVQEIIARKGLIGMNFLRAYVNNERPEALEEHIRYGIEKGAGDVLCFGADFFYTKDHPDKSRIPFYFQEHENATKYAGILERLGAEGMDEEQLRKISYENAQSFMIRLWE